MAEQPINSDEIIDKGIFTSLLKEADMVIAKEKEIIAINKTLLSSYRDIANVNIGNDSKSLIQQAENTKKVENSIKDLNSAEINLINTEKAKVQLQQEEVKLQKMLDAENRKQIKTLNELNGEYKKGTQDLNRLKKELKELEFTGRTNGKLYKSLSNEFNTLDSKVRKAEGSVKEFQRNVGNYPKTLDSITGKLAGAFSVGAIINFGKKILETRAEFQKFEAVLTNTLGSNSAAQSVLSRIQELASKTPFSVKELTESFVKLANQGFKPTNEELTKLGDLAASQGKSFDQLTEGIIDAQTGEFERLKEFGIKAKKSGENVEFTFKGVKTQVKNTGDEINKYVLSLGDLAGVSGGMAAIADTLGGKISNLGDGFDMFFNNLGENSEGVFSFFLDKFNDFLGIANKAQTTLNKINRELKAGGGSQSYIDNLLGGNANLNALNNTLEKISTNGQGAAKQTAAYGKAIAYVKAQYVTQQIDQETYKNSLILIKASQDKLNESLNTASPIKEKNAKLTDKQVKSSKELAKIKGGESEKLQSIKITKIEEEIKFDDKAFDEKLDRETAQRKYEQDYNNEQEDLRLKAKKEKQEKELKEAIDFGKQLLDLVAKEIAEKSKLKQEGIDKDISDTQKNIDTQRNLAQRGLANTLVEEEARKVQLERQKEEEKQKEIKRQKALAFFKLFASYAEKDPNTALQKALKDTIIAEAVSAAFIDGTENVGKDAQFSGNKFKNGQDGYIAKFDGDERIINPEQNKMIGNLSNEALADLAYKHNNGLLDTAKYGVIQSNDFASNIANSALLMATMQTNKRLESLEQAIINKPVTNFAFDQYGDFIKETIEGGFTKRTTVKLNKPRI